MCQIDLGTKECGIMSLCSNGAKHQRLSLESLRGLASRTWQKDSVSICVCLWCIFMLENVWTYAKITQVINDVLTVFLDTRVFLKPLRLIFFYLFFFEPVLLFKLNPCKCFFDPRILFFWPLHLLSWPLVLCFRPLVCGCPAWQSRHMH